MRKEQSQWTDVAGWTNGNEAAPLGPAAQIAFIFGSPETLQASECFERARSQYPNAHLVGCSTAGEILGTTVTQNSVAMTALAFDGARVAATSARLTSVDDSRAAGEALGRSLPHEGLTHAFVLLDALGVNASELLRGLSASLPRGTPVSGGCAADGDRFEHTWVWCDFEPTQSAAVAVGFYGEHLKIHTAATGAWGPFGPDRLVTKSKGNILYELDGRSALSLYKTYLGEHAAQLPVSGLLFPLMMHRPGSEHCMLRAPMGVIEADQAIICAGEVPEGWYARLMRGTVERLLEGARDVASVATRGLNGATPDFALVVSCNGRRHVLKQRIEEEIEVVEEVFGVETTLTGFYSHGEIAPLVGGEGAELHNETLTITAFCEN